MQRSAVHEAGHAVAALEIGIAFASASIRGADGQGGAFIGAGRRYLSTDFDICDDLVCLLAGRAAEQVVFGAPSNGAGGDESSDLAQATWLAARATAEFGFDDQYGLLWMAMAERKSELRETLSRDLALADRVRRRLTAAYSDACALVRRRRSAIDAVSAALLASGALDGDEVARIVDRATR
jgi:cell division protease FtsH